MKILTVGAGGYASLYVDQLLKHKPAGVVWEGVVEPYFDTCSTRDAIIAAGVPVYKTMEEFYSEHTADLAVIATPSHFHCEQSLCALSRGSYVLCEKPIAPTVAEAKAMLDAEEASGRFIAIGYQWSYSDAIQSLKRDILDGRLGRPISMKTAISWPRSRGYYRRGAGWGGRISMNGRLILDSILSNACAHYVHNMFFLLGESMDRSAHFESFEAECLRANGIESFDTCAMRIAMPDGVSLYFIASHAAGRNRNPEFVYTFENGEIRYGQGENAVIRGYLNNGETVNYGNPFANDGKKLWDVVSAVRNHQTPVCGVQTALPHTELVEAVYRTTPIQGFDPALVKINSDNDTVYVEGLYEKMYRAYRDEKLLREEGETER